MLAPFRHACGHDAFSVFPFGKMLPQLFSDERHERMQHSKESVEESECGFVCRAVDGLAVGRFHHFKIPGREFIPEQLVDGHKGFGYTELAHKVRHFGQRVGKQVAEPFCPELRRLRLSVGIADLPAFHEAESVPYLVAEIAPLFA